MSKIANEVYEELKNIFPNGTILKEHYIRYKRSKLFFDIYMKDLGILIEIQGRQHTKFVKHFHGSIDKFRAQKYRDNLKKEFIQENARLCLVYFYDEEDKITKKLILKRIYEAQHKEDGV